MSYQCLICGADNRFVNECGCDPNNMPTVPTKHDFLVLLYYAERIRPLHVKASCYAEAIEAVAPGNDVIKLEVISS